MGPKQAEMDKIAETIYKTLVAKDSALQASDLPTLFILCGDHGMNEVGNHGGSSRSEISTSFLFMSSSFDNSRYQSQIDAMVGNYRFTEDREEYQHYRSVNQVDLVPTLSLLLGLPIPKNNVGRFIPEVLLDYEEAEILRAYQLNAHQVAGVLKNMWPDFETESSVLLKDFKNPDIEEETSEEFKRDAQRCKNEGVQKQRLVCWYTLALAGHASVLERMRAMDRGVPNLEAETHRIGWEAKKTYDQFLDEASSMLSTALSKYDMPLLTNGSLMMAFAVGGLIFCAMQTSLPRDVMASCVEPRQSAYLFGKGPSLSRQKGTPGRSTSGSLTSIFGERIPKTKRSRKRDRNEINWIIARILSAVILILYLVTLFASSFVEEEHQFWYFFNMTWWAVLAFTSGRYLASSNSSARPPSEKHSKDETRHEKRLSSSATAAVYCLLQMVILRVLRGWNQTGQKYADQIDLRHYLNATWVGVSWILFWITMAIVVATMVFFTTSFHSPFSGGHRYHRNQQPAWKSGLISVLQALLTTSIVLAALWITVYKMDVESAYFGDEVMRRVHAFTGTLSSVGYPAVAAAEASSTQEVGMSGYAMARGCYATLGAIAVMSYGLKALSSSGSASSASDTVRSGPESMEPITEMYTGTLFVPSMLLGTATLLLILLSRRHNAPLFVFFGMQLYLYLKWISLIRQRDLDSEEQDGAEYDDSITYIDEDVQADEISSDSAIDKAHLNTMETRNTGVSSRSLRSLPGQNSIHSCSILLWTLSSFFLFGNSNSIASIDISNAYVGIQAYDIGLTGVLTFVSNWAGPIWWCLAAAVVMKWDLEIELVCAKQDRQIVLKEEEEQSWRTVSRWRREDKGTWNKKTKRRIQLYKRALAKSQEDSTKEGETVGKEASMSPEPNAHPLNLESTEQHAQDFATNQDEPANLEDEDTFYVYEEQDTSAAVIEDSVSPLPHSSVPCILTDPPGYRRHLMQTRILDHLIFSSLFFGIALYALSIAAIVLRHHLFIWTVFSPKVLYQFAWTVLFQLVVQVLAVGCGVWSIVMVL
ncbi:major facilitator super transporter protein [Gamsiella multidivaricata]|nr:major facilitator super transporter protein [Gamsiella multidivaricata]